jgi:hypothetical protein
MLVIRALLAFALLVLPVRAWAMDANVPCESPSVFSSAAVNVVVLPYSLPASFNATTSAVGEQLGAMVQLETVLSIAKYGSIGVVQLIGNTRQECTPEIVLDKLTGKTGGAREKMRPGAALILIWGRIFESGPDLYLQSYIRFLRLGVEESIDLAVRDRTLKGTLSTQAFACAPRKIAIRDISDIQRQFAAARLLHAKPDAASPVVKMPEGRGPFSYWITSLQGDWVQLQPMDRSTPSDRKLAPGWLQVRAADAQWSLRRQMPELYFIEAVAGYLTARTRTNSATVVDTALQYADTALTRYLDAWGANAVLGGDPAANGTPLAVGVPRQLRGFVALLRGRGSDAALTEARTQFERAAALTPHSSHARNLVTMTRVAQTYRQPSADQPPRRFIDDWRGLLGSDPDNRNILTNLGAIYDLVLSTVPGAPSSWNLSVAERDLIVKQRERLKALFPRT